MADKVEAAVIDDAIDIAARTGEIVIDADDIGVIFEQTLAKMRAKKSGAARYNDACFKMHVKHPLTAASR